MIQNRDAVAALRARRRAEGFVTVTVWVPNESVIKIKALARRLIDSCGRPMPGDLYHESRLPEVEDE